MGKKTARYPEDQSPNMRPRRSPRNDDYSATGVEQDSQEQSIPTKGARSEQVPAGEQAQANPPTFNSAPPTPSMEQMMAQMLQMMSVQQQSLLASQQNMQETVLNNQQQMQEFMVQQAAFQSEMFAQQSRANQQKQRANPPKFLGKQDEDLELWIFQIEEHFAAYTTERESNDSRFVNMVVPFLGPDVMPWYREFKASVGEAPRTWSLFKEHIRARFRDSDFEYKLLTKMYELQVTGTQQEYTSKFMLLLSQASVEIPDVIKRWFYQQNIQADTSSYIYQNIPTSLQDTIEHAQRFEDARKPSRTRASAGLPGANTIGRQGGRRQQGRGPSAGGSPHPRPTPPASQSPIAGSPEVTCFTCGVKGHKSPDCPRKGTGAKN